MMDSAFWDALDQLIAQSRVIIDRPKGTSHPKYPNCIYPVDYGYLAETASMDGEGIDVWRGSCEKQTLNGIICTVDLLKQDSEIKLLLGCAAEEQKSILAFHNDSAFMKGIFIPRERLTIKSQAQK